MAKPQNGVDDLIHRDPPRWGFERGAKQVGSMEWYPGGFEANGSRGDESAQGVLALAARSILSFKRFTFELTARCRFQSDTTYSAIKAKMNE
jgi:hypothetical protein